jgi:cholesterol transport system auxiliary component
VSRPAKVGAVIAVAALTAAALAACTGSLFRSKAAPPTVYVLSAELPSPGAATIAADLAVLKPRLRTGLESDRIAVLYPDRRLDYFADARWSGPLGDVLQDFALREFHSRTHLRSVTGDTSVLTNGYWLEIEALDFQAEYTAASAPPTVRVHLLVRIGDSGYRRILGRFEAEARQQATENRLSAIVDAYARAADTALAEIATRTDETLAKASEPR